MNSRLLLRISARAAASSRWMSRVKGTQPFSHHSFGPVRRLLSSAADQRCRGDEPVPRRGTGSSRACSIGNHQQGSDMTSQRGPSSVRDGQPGLGVAARRYLPNLEVALGIQGGNVLREALRGQLAVGHHGLEVGLVAPCQVAADLQPHWRGESLVERDACGARRDAHRGVPNRPRRTRKYVIATTAPIPTKIVLSVAVAFSPHTPKTTATITKTWLSRCTCPRYPYRPARLRKMSGSAPAASTSNTPATKTAAWTQPLFDAPNSATPTPAARAENKLGTRVSGGRLEWL